MKRFVLAALLALPCLVLAEQGAHAYGWLMKGPQFEYPGNWYNIWPSGGGGSGYGGGGAWGGGHHGPFPYWPSQQMNAGFGGFEAHMGGYGYGGDCYYGQ
jgi:hypothetical protein